MLKTILPLLILILLGGIYFYTKDDPQDTSIDLDDRDFVVEDREIIDIIVIKRPGYPEMHLSKSNDGWLLNQRKKASPHVVKNLLSVLTQMKLDYIPPKTKYTKIMKDIELLGIDVTTYDKSGKVLSDFIVGKNNNIESGTYCLKKGAKQPYVMIVPSVGGGIRNYFTHTDVDLRDKTVLDINSNDIIKVTVDYKKDRANSFVITKEGTSYNIKPIVPTTSTNQLKQNQNVLTAYIKDFKKFGAESLMTGKPGMDSLSRTMPFVELAIDMKDGSQLGFSFYPVTDVLNLDATLRTVNDLKQIDRYNMFASDGESYMVQHRLVKKLFKPILHFDI